MARDHVVTRAAARMLTTGIALVLGLFLTVPAAVAAPAATPAPAAPAAASEPTLRLGSFSPAVTRPGDVLQLMVTVDNSTDADLTGATLELAVGWKRLRTRAALDEWVTGDAARPTTQLVADVPDIAPGTSKNVTLELPVDGLGLGGGPRGPRELSVALRDGRTVTAQLRTFLVWDPTPVDGTASDANLTPGVDAVDLSILAPVTCPASDPADPLSTDSLAEVTTADGRLARVRAAVDAAAEGTGTRGALSLAVDPALVATGLTSSDARVVTWAESVARLGDATDVHPLPPYDPDLAALGHAGLTQDGLRAATTAVLPDAWTVPTTWGDTIAWPAGSQAPDLATLAAARAAGITTVVLPAGLTPVRGVATGLAPVTTMYGTITALVSDAEISQALTEAVSASTPTSAGTTTPSEAVQRLLAETAVVSTQGAGQEPHLLATLPRDWIPDVAALNTTLRTLVGSGWVRVTPVSDLLTAPDPAVQRTPLADHAAQRDELAPDNVRLLDTSRTTLREFSRIADDPTELVTPLDAALAAPSSVAWRSASPASRNKAVTTAVDAVHAVTSSLSVAATDVTLISTQGKLPVNVANQLDTDVTVQVKLSPDTPRLVVDPVPVTTVPANGQVRVDVPVRALASGDVAVTVQVLTESGTQVATPVTLRLAVRAGWETVGTAVAAGVVALLLVVGIVRTIRRGRSPRRAVDVDVPDPLLPGETT